MTLLLSDTNTKIKTSGRGVCAPSKTMILYYVEEKFFYRDTQGNDRQFADGGTIPTLYHTAEKAIQNAKDRVKNGTDVYNYQITIDNSKYPYQNRDVLYATRLEDKDRRMRIEIRVYEIKTRI